VRGTPIRVGGEDNDRNDPGTEWKSPVYSCATILRAYIMDVTFFINGTATLDNLKVRKAMPRAYSSNATTPLWGVEATGMNISDVEPIWGLVDDKYEKASNMWTIRREHLYLPSGSSSFRLGVLGSSDSLAVSGPGQVLSALYGSLDIDAGDRYTDYTGKASYPLSLKWGNLTAK
jgi:hypothetical protein